jgi:hypothetical protein
MPSVAGETRFALSVAQYSSISSPTATSNVASEYAVVNPGIEALFLAGTENEVAELATSTALFCSQTVTVCCALSVLAY